MGFLDVLDLMSVVLAVDNAFGAYSLAFAVKAVVLDVFVGMCSAFGPLLSVSARTFPVQAHRRLPQIFR